MALSMCFIIVILNHEVFKGPFEEYQNTIFFSMLRENINIQNMMLVMAAEAIFKRISYVLCYIIKYQTDNC